MSNIKRFAIIVAVEFLLLIVGFVNAILAENGDDPNFRSEFMLGYSLPIVTLGIIVFFCSVYIFREKKSAIRREL
jgi:hypothetical protein